MKLATVKKIFFSICLLVLSSYYCNGDITQKKIAKIHLLCIHRKYAWMTFSTSEDFFFLGWRKLSSCWNFLNFSFSYEGGNNKLIFRLSFHFTFIFVLTWLLFTLVGNFLIKYLWNVEVKKWQRIKMWMLWYLEHSICFNQHICHFWGCNVFYKAK